MERQAIVALLGRSDVFGSLTASDLHSITGRMRRIDFEPRQMIFSRGKVRLSTLTSEWPGAVVRAMQGQAGNGEKKESAPEGFSYAKFGWSALQGFCVVSMRWKPAGGSADGLATMRWPPVRMTMRPMTRVESSQRVCFADAGGSEMSWSGSRSYTISTSSISSEVLS